MPRRHSTWASECSALWTILCRAETIRSLWYVTRNPAADAKRSQSQAVAGVKRERSQRAPDMPPGLLDEEKQNPGLQEPTTPLLIG